MKVTDALFGLTDLKWGRPDIADIQDFDEVTAGGCTYRLLYGVVANDRKLCTIQIVVCRFLIIIY